MIAIAKYIIIGNGIAGTTAVDAIREVDASGDIVVISDERKRPYSRVALRQYIEGSMQPEQMFIRPEGFYKRMTVKTILGKRVVNIDPLQREVTLQTGKTLQYEKLLLATGGHAVRPNIDGQEAGGIFVLNTWADADKIIKACAAVREAVVVGGGFIGTEAAEAIHSRGVKCSIVEIAGRLLPRMLDERAAGRVAKAAEKLGIDVYLGERVVAFETRKRGKGTRVCGVRLESGKTLPCQLVVMATGVAPRLELAQLVGIKTNQGILVNERMQTSEPNIYAAGDAVETHDVVYNDSRVNALWTTGVEQGRAAGYNMAGRDMIYPGALAANSLPVFNVATASIGCTTAMFPEDQEIALDSDRRYMKVIVRGSRLAGAVIVGDTTIAGPLQTLIRQQADVTPFIPLFREGSFSYASLFHQRTTGCRI